MSATRPEGIKFEPLALTVVSSYEAAALLSGRLPTITTLTKRLPRSVRRLLAVGVGYWMLGHFELR